MNYIEIIERKNGFVSICLRTWFENNKRFFQVEDELGNRVLSEDQVVSEPIDILMNELKNFKVHPILLRNIKKTNSQTNTRESKIKDFFYFIELFSLKFKDMRSKGGAFWLYDSDFTREKLIFLGYQGFKFAFAKNSKTLGNKPGWYLVSSSRSS